MSSAYNLRRRNPVDYRTLDEGIKIPRSRCVPADELYPILVLERAGEKVKIHYEGYGEEFDEWKDESEIVCPEKPEVYQPFELHRELAYQIKVSLNLSGRRDPDIRIEVPFDKLLFEGGLKQAGHYIQSTQGNEVYGIRKYADLTPLLGKNWYIRGLNERMDFCYIDLHSLRFYLYKRQPLMEYTPNGKQDINSGHTLIFKFVRMDGVKDDWDRVVTMN